MKIAPYVIESFAKFILSGKTFYHLAAAVDYQQVTGKTGPEKRAAVIAQFKAMGFELAEWLLNLGIELAVAWAKSKAGAK